MINSNMASMGELTVPDGKLYETWESVHDKSLELAHMIEADCVAGGEKFDVMLAVPRGSYYPVNIVSRELGFGSTDLLHASLSSYAVGETEREREFRLGQMPTPQEVAGRDILIIEEVCDTGHTLSYLYGLLELAGAGLVRTGVLHYKPGKTETNFVPDWFVHQTDQWIVYPWEPYETNGKTSQVRRRQIPR